MISLCERKNTDFVIPKNDGKEVTLAGFVDSVRKVGKNLLFVVLKDREADAQLTFKKENFSEEGLEKVGNLHSQSVIAVQGTIRKSKMCKRGVEVIVKKYNILSESAPKLPIDFNVDSNLDTRLDFRWIDLRTERNTAIFRILSDFAKFSRDYLSSVGFIEIFSSKLMGAPSEGGAEVFSVPYFGKKAYLAQSPQFYKQMALSSGFERVMEVGPVFRAEPSFTTRHLTEFTGLDFEMAYIDSVEDVMRTEENMISYAMAELKKKWGRKIREIFGVDIAVPKTPFPRITIKQACEILNKRGINVKYGYDLGTLGEKEIGRYVKEKYGHDFVFLVEYPWKLRPFYHLKDSEKDISMSFDLVYNGLEITTGAQREHRYDVLLKQAREKKLNIKLIEFYLDFFKYGCPPHGGLGFGPSRFVQKLLNLDNIREATLLPRDPKRISP